MKQERVVPLVKSGTPGSTSWGGWEKPLDAELDQLEADIAGLEDRLNHPVRPGVPAAYAGVREFHPERQAFLFDTAQNGTSSVLVNYVVKDGVTYDIPIRFPGPGIFVAKSLNVAIKRRYVAKVGAFGAQHPLDMSVGYAKNMYGAHIQGAIPQFTVKFSLPNAQPQQRADLSAGSHPLDLSMNFFWNMLDGKSGRRIADELMSFMVLTPRTTMYTLGPSAVETVAISLLHDGAMFSFPVPWVFERDGQATFQFRPITPVLQFDSSIDGTVAFPNGPGYTFDDRVNGTRDTTVTVTVEMHGYRYETDQDALKAGALTRR